jgi:lipoyl(octanoyl) transferase
MTVTPLFAHLKFLNDAAPRRAAWNMAADEAMLTVARGAVLRVYRWERPAVSFGYFTASAAVEAAWPAREHVRRWTGGGMVPHGEDLTYALIVPVTEEFFRVGPAESYRRVHEVVADCLRAVGLEAGLAAEGGSRPDHPCFAGPVRHDVVWEGRKVAGAAQRRNRRGMLHQGSIQGVDLPEGWAKRLARGLGQRVVEREMQAEEEALADRLAVEKYGTEKWLRRW